MYRGWRIVTIVGVVIACVAAGLAQSEIRTKTLVINGRRGEATMYVIDGKAFVAVETIARIGHAEVTFQGDEIVVTFPPAPSSSSDAHSAAASSMTPDFMREAIRCLSSLKEWQTVLARAIQRGVPGDGSRLVVFHDRAAEGLRLATVAASTSSDQNALQLLSNNFAQVDNWTRKLVQERKSMSSGNYSLTPDALDNDSEYQRLANCSNAVGSILSSGRYEDSSDCH